MESGGNVAMDIQRIIAEITDVVPDIHKRANSSTLLVLFEKVIPTHEETAKIQDALKAYGDVIVNSYRKGNFVSFMIRPQ